MTTLVTGATGFACAHVVQALAQAGERVIALDLVPESAAYRQFLGGYQERVRFVTGDVLDTAAMQDLAEEYGVRRFVHGAAITPTVEMERDNPQRIVDVNLMGTVSLLEVARAVAAERFVLMSSTGIYAPLDERGAVLTEQSPLQSGGLYMICKISGEQVLRRYRDLFGLSTVSGRMSSIYGPMERATATRTRPSVIYTLVRACLAGQPFQARGLANRRCYVHASDAGRIWQHLTLAADLDHDVYNVSSGAAYSLAEVLAVLRSLEPGCMSAGQSPKQRTVEVAHVGDRNVVDISRVVEEFEFAPRYDLREGLSTYLAWAREHPDLVDRDQTDRDA